MGSSPPTFRSSGVRLDWSTEDALSRPNRGVPAACTAKPIKSDQVRSGMPDARHRPGQDCAFLAGNREQERVLSRPPIAHRFESSRAILVLGPRTPFVSSRLAKASLIASSGTSSSPAVSFRRTSSRISSRCKARTRR